MHSVKKSLKTVGNAISWVLVVLAVFMIIFTLISSLLLEKEERNLFGVRAFAVLSDSMSATDFDAGDVVFVRAVDAATVKVGDIISFKSVDPDSQGDIITHKVRSLTTDSQGNPGFITYGTTTGQDDTQIVTYPYVVGKYIFSVPRVGEFFAFVRTPAGYMILVFMPIAVIMVIQAVNSYKLYKLYKAGESSEVKDLKSQRREQSAANADILEELKKTKALLEAELKKEASDEIKEEPDSE